MKTITLTFLLIAAKFNPGFAESSPAPAPQHSADYIAHEWGTFTSVQGADGVQFEWNPFIKWDLPEFVYDRNRPSHDTNLVRYVWIASKGAYLSRQRMETPVLYFYADQPHTLDVEIQFPMGTVTEWFPRVSDFGPRPALTTEDPRRAQRSFIRWEGVRVGAHSDESHPLPAFPSDGRPNHYYAARQTDAVPLFMPALPEKGYAAESERFLFYRGVGGFQAPLRMSFTESESVVKVANTGRADLQSAVLVRIRSGRASMHPVGTLAAGKSADIPLPEPEGDRPLASVSSELSDYLEGGLKAAGLYEREARAMIATWRDAWFEEDGLRVLYLLPQIWTESVLPLRLSPPPRELVRVMVGRAEAITPSMEWDLLRHVVRYHDAAPQDQAAVVRTARSSGLGRFAEPAMRRILGMHPKAEYRDAANALVRALAGPEIPSNPLAQLP